MTQPSEDLLLTNRLIDAANFAAVRHQYLRRSGYPSLPYINHLLKVTQTLIRVIYEADPDTLVAALLHDIIEDTPTTHQELSQKFGHTVADIVAELTDDMSLPYSERKRLQVEGVQHLSVPAQKIRIADKGCNINDILNYPIKWSAKRKQMYVTFAEQVVDPLRGRYPQLEAWFDEQIVQAKLQLFP